MYIVFSLYLDILNYISTAITFSFIMKPSTHLYVDKFTVAMLSDSRLKML